MLITLKRWIICIYIVRLKYVGKISLWNSKQLLRKLQKILGRYFLSHPVYCWCVWSTAGFRAQPLHTVCWDHTSLSHCSATTTRWSTVPAAAIFGTFGLHPTPVRRTSCWKKLPNFTETGGVCRQPLPNSSTSPTLHDWLCTVSTCTQFWYDNDNDTRALFLSMKNRTPGHSEFWFLFHVFSPWELYYWGWEKIIFIIIINTQCIWRARITCWT